MEHHLALILVFLLMLQGKEQDNLFEVLVFVEQKGVLEDYIFSFIVIKKYSPVPFFY